MAQDSSAPPPARGGLDLIGPGWALPGRGVRLRPFQEADLPARLRMTNDPDVQLQTVGMTVGERTPYDIRSWFKALSQDPTARLIAIEDGQGRYLGDLDLHSVDLRRGEAWVEALLGDPELRARGPDPCRACLQDALTALVGFAFRELGIRRVLAEVLSTNPAGLEAHRALGFAEVGQIDHMNGVISHVLELTPERFTPAP